MNTDKFEILNNVEFHSRELELVECGKETTSPDKHIGPYRRDIYLFHLCVEGRGVYCNGNSRREIGQGDMFLIRPDETVEYFPDPSNPWTYLWVGFSGTVASALLKNTYFADKYVMRKVSGGVYNYLYAIINEYNVSGRLSLKTLGFFYLLLSEIEKEAAEVVLKPTDRYVREAVKYIKYNLENDVSLEDIANSLKIAPNYLVNIFTEAMGVSPIRYLSECRLERALTLLKQNKNIDETYPLCGYKRRESFIKAFKRRYGYLPKAVRTNAEDGE